MQLTKIDNAPMGALSPEDIRKLWDQAQATGKKENLVSYKLKVELSQEVFDALEKLTGQAQSKEKAVPTFGEIPMADAKQRDLFTSFKGQVADAALDA